MVAPRRGFPYLPRSRPIFSDFFGLFKDVFQSIYLKLLRSYANSSSHYDSVALDSKEINTTHNNKIRTKPEKMGHFILL